MFNILGQRTERWASMSWIGGFGRLLPRLLVLLPFIGGCSLANGQISCPTPWDTASTVYGTVFVDGGGTGNNGPYTTNTVQSAAMQVEMQAQIACSWTTATQGGLGTGSDVVSINDQLKDTTCPATQTDSWVGSGFGVNLQVSLGITSFFNQYSFSPFDEVNGTFSQRGCINASTPLALSLGPLNNTQQTLPLPDTASLSGSTSFTDLPQDTAQTNIPVNWNLSWNFSPFPDQTCEECDEALAAQLADQSASKIDSRNQSLGEDIPVIGTPYFLHYESSRAPGRSGADAVAILEARNLGGWTLSVHHAMEPLLLDYCMGGSCTLYSKVPKALFLGTGATRTDDEIQAPILVNGGMAITAEDGSEVYVFGSNGLHLQTLHPMTGAVEYSFAYDAFDRLIKVTDENNNVTTIQRDVNGNATAIVAPFGQTTQLAVDSNGFLSQIVDPAGHKTVLVNSVSGLLTSFTDPRGKVYTFQYDGFGRLAKHSDPAGGFVSLTHTDAASGFTTTQTTAAGRSSSFQVLFSSSSTQSGRNFTNTWPNGLQASNGKTLQAGKMTESGSLPNGVSDAATEGMDPRWGLQVPITTSETLGMGNLTMTTTRSRIASLNNPSDPFSLNTQTDTDVVNGRTYSTVFTTSNMSLTGTSPAGRKQTILLDSKERPASIQVTGLSTVQLTYDSHGRLASVTRGARHTRFRYNAKGFLAGATDPLGLQTSYTYDADGRRISATLPDGRIIGYTYDANGNLASITPPGKTAHKFAFSPVNAVASYTPPAVSGTGATTYAYNPDTDLLSITPPGGQQIKFAYDTAGRLISSTTPTSTIQYGFDPITGNLSSASVTGGEQTTYSYNGPIPTLATWTGPVAGSVGSAFNNNLWITSQTLNGANTISFQYDNDGLLTHAGSLVLKRNSANGLLTGTTLGLATDTRTYNSFAEEMDYTASYNGSPLYGVQYVRDLDGRITSATEAIGGTTNVYTYSYDNADRLTGVDLNGSNAASFTYDSNSNRLSATTSTGTVTASYDAQDRLLDYGSASYTFDADGQLTQKSVGTQITSYQYDLQGNLLEVTLPDGTSIQYIVDAIGNRVGKRKNGALVNGFLYDEDSVVAQLNAANQIVSQFVYATGSTSPDYMVKGGVKYRIFTDPLGSPRLVVNISNGQIAQRMDYDAFGNVIGDTSPGFQPFGFAGGLYDPDTGLVRFGARDYDANLGRWTAKDPIRFDGGDTNFYSYAHNDPINLQDPSGLEAGTIILINPSGNKNDRTAYQNAQNYQSPEGTLTVIAHGSPGQVYGPDHKPISIEDLKRTILRDKHWDSDIKTIRLVICRAGAVPVKKKRGKTIRGRSVRDQLQDEFGDRANVAAPVTKVGVTGEGKVVVVGAKGPTSTPATFN